MSSFHDGTINVMNSAFCSYKLWFHVPLTFWSTFSFLFHFIFTIFLYVTYLLHFRGYESYDLKNVYILSPVCTFSYHQKTWILVLAWLLCNMLCSYLHLCYWGIGLQFLRKSPRAIHMHPGKERKYSLDYSK